MSRFRGKRHLTRQRLLPTGLAPRDLIAWIESLPDDQPLSGQDAHKLNEALADLTDAGVAAVEPIIERLLPSQNERSRWLAITALAQIGDPRANDPLWAIYQRDQDMHAFNALSQLQDERIFDLAVAMLNGERANLKLAAVFALHNLGDARAVDILVPLLHQRSPQLRNAALRALAAVLIACQGENTLGIFALADILNQANITLTNSGQAGHLRSFLIDTLAQIDHPEARACLYAAIRQPRPSVRGRALKAIQQLWLHKS